MRTGVRTIVLAKAVRLSFAAHVEDATDQTVYSGGVWNGVALGMEKGNRKIVLGIVGRNSIARTISSVTVGGFSLAAAATQTGDTGNDVAALWIGDVPSGATGNIIITWSGSMQRCGAGVWAMYGAASSTPADTKGGSTQTTNVSLTVPARGVGIGVSLGVGGTSATWTNMTEEYDISVETTVIHSGADLTSSSGAIVSVTAAWLAAPSTSAPAILASWGP